MTKKEAIARKAAWGAALTEGRVVRYNKGLSMRSFATADEAQAFVRQIKTFCPDEMAEIVNVAGE
jgi:hypothetical protein